METLLLTIERFDGSKSYKQQYEVPYFPGKTILSHLFYIKENLDSTLNFTASCRSAICGACAIRVNGNAFLACDTRMEKMVQVFKTKELTLAPLGNFTVINDLVVDWDDKIERLKLTKPTIKPKQEFSQDKGCRQTPADFNKIAVQWDCILCGVCASECTALSLDSTSFLEPFTFVQAERNAIDSRSTDPMYHGIPALKHGLWNCVRCFQCIKCPKDIRPAGRISSLRGITMKHGVKNNLGARHAYAFLTDLRHGGRLNESKLLLRTEGIVVMKRTALAIRLLLHGKVNPFELFHQAKVTGHIPLAKVVNEAMSKQGVK